MTSSEFGKTFAAALNAGLSVDDALVRIRSKAIKTTVKTAIFKHMHELAASECLSMIEKDIEKDVENELNEFRMIDGWYDWKVKAFHDSKKEKLIVQVAVKYSKNVEYTIYSSETDC